MQQTNNIVVIAGEESGDCHAASFIRELKKNNSALHITGIGGRHMQAEGVELISDLAKYGVTGLSEVVRHLLVIKKAFNAIKDHLKKNKPDLLILVDYPGFNLRLAKYAKHVLGIRILYYISPQIWAWKAGRINTIRDCVDRMAVILPFEKKIYENACVPVSFVGHPLVEKLTTESNQLPLREQLRVPKGKKLIAFLPGSRINEIERHMPVLFETAKKLYASNPSLHFVIPIAGTIPFDVIDHYFKDSAIPYSLIKGMAVETAQASDCVVVASGTASLECALLEKPMCIIYKVSLLTYIAATKVIKINYLGLCNILQNEMIVPELLQYDCNPVELTRVITDLLEDSDIVNRMTHRLNRMKKSLSSLAADCSISTLIERELEQSKLMRIN